MPSPHCGESCIPQHCTGNGKNGFWRYLTLMGWGWAEWLWGEVPSLQTLYPNPPILHPIFHIQWAMSPGWPSTSHPHLVLRQFFSSDNHTVIYSQSSEKAFGNCWKLPLDNRYWNKLSPHEIRKVCKKKALTSWHRLCMCCVYCVFITVSISVLKTFSTWPLPSSSEPCQSRARVWRIGAQPLVNIDENGFNFIRNFNWHCPAR